MRHLRNLACLQIRDIRGPGLAASNDPQPSLVESALGQDVQYNRRGEYSTRRLLPPSANPQRDVLTPRRPPSLVVAVLLSFSFEGAERALALRVGIGLITALVLAGAAFAQPAIDRPVVQLADGALSGKIADGVVSFKGVPFAAPPVGDLRWREPAPVQASSGVRDAVAFGPPCAQGAFSWNSNLAAKSSEDCLYLNVWAPVGRRDKPLPVMIFFHGGAFHGGAAAGSSMIEPSYDGAKLARRGVVVVTASYRLGMFGFLAHPQLTAESPHHASGDYALLDNIAALRWVHANIARFGGDPGNVTALGQSAGSVAVGFLMTSPLAKGLFQRAIFHSGAAVDPDITLKDAETNGEKFAAALDGGTGGIADLRRRSAQALLQTMMSTPALRQTEPREPPVEGFVLPEQPARVFADGREAAIPLIVGSTARDGDLASMGVSGTPKAVAASADPTRPVALTHNVAPLSDAGTKAVQAYYADYPDLATSAAKLYSVADETDPADGDVATAFNTDVIFRCGAALMAQWHARRAPTWRYEFSHGYEPLGAVHIWDMLYLFGWLQPPADQPRDARLSDELQRYWVAFAASGDPNAAGLPAWPLNGANGGYLDFTSDGPVAKTGPRQAACAIFARKNERDFGAMRANVKTH